VPDLPSPHPTNTRDGAALLSERFAGRGGMRAVEPESGGPSSAPSVAAQLIANWFAPARPAEEDG
jgi:hypothetical protein